MALFDCTGDRRFADDAIWSADQLYARQVGGKVSENPAAGCFYDSPSVQKIGWNNPLGPIGLCALAERFPEHPDYKRWLEMIERIADQFETMSQRNPWGLVPVRWYSDPHPGARKAGSAFFRYFNPNWCGFNQLKLFYAVFLVQASRLLGKSAYVDVAARQIDWVLGCNPLGASFVEGVGYNQPKAKGFGSDNPQVPGAVMTGFQGLPDDDSPYLFITATEYDVYDVVGVISVLCEWLQHFGDDKHRVSENPKMDLAFTLASRQAVSFLPQQWTIFGPLKRSYTLTKDQMSAMPAVIATGDGNLLPQSATATNGRLDLAPCLGGVEVNRSAYVFIPIELSDEKEVAFGFGADWWFEAFLDGNPICDTIKQGNGPGVKMSMYNYVKMARLGKGKHLLVIHFISGMMSSVLCAGMFEMISQSQTQVTLDLESRSLT